MLMSLLWVLILTFMLITKVTNQVQQPTEIWWPNPFFRLLSFLFHLCGHFVATLWTTKLVHRRSAQTIWVKVLVFPYEMRPLLQYV